ncbi:MAG TPA: hypothetical protein VGI19_14985 [Candidatus Cybelea sp.]
MLYVSGNSGYVYIFSVPGGKLVGTLTGFQEVAGVCADAAGNVWVANSAAFNLIEYAHGGDSPIAMLSDYESYPFSCSVDFRTGDLAVANIFSIQYGQQGGVAIYRGAKGTPKIYTDPSFTEYYFLSYGLDGKIYFDGLNASGDGFEMARFYRRHFTPIVISGATITTPGGVQYAEGSLTVGGTDPSGNAIVYRVSQKGAVTGSTQLSGAYSCVSYEIWKTSMFCASSNGDVPVYRYPVGGDPIATIGASLSAFQAVVSKAPKR